MSCDINQSQCHKCTKGQKILVSEREENHDFLSFYTLVSLSLTDLFREM